MEQDDYPDAWTCTSEDKRVHVEIRVRDIVPPDDPTGLQSLEETYRWIEIPTTSVEHWVEKGDAADIQRTAKVECPTEWGENTDDVQHNSPRQLIDTATGQDDAPFTLARVWWQDTNGDWILEHIGWVGGVGSTGDSSTSKFWVYDFAELLSSVPIGTSFKQPTVETALEIVAKLTNDNSSVPISDTRYIPPEAEELQGTITTSTGDTIRFGDGEATKPIESDNVLDGYYHVYKTLNGDDVTQAEVSGLDGFVQFAPGTTFDASGTIDTGQGDAQGFLEGSGSELLDGDVGGAISSLGTEDETQKKKFESNHDTLQDVYSWLGDKVNGNLHFEPELGSVSLVADVRTSRRVFAQRAVIERQDEADESEENPFNPSLITSDFVEEFFSGDGSEYIWHESVTVIKNDALYEMKPINTLKLRGAMSTSLVGDTDDDDELEQIGVQGVGISGFDGLSKTFPSVTVQVPSLLEAAEGAELSPEVVESDVGELDEAETEAKKIMAERLEEATEGEIILDGQPGIMPYDRVDAFEVCGEEVTFEQIPASYEVESVKHMKTAGGRYKTYLNVSIWANDKTMETVRKEMIEA